MPDESNECTDEIAALIDGRIRGDDGVIWLERLTRQMRRAVDDSAPEGATVTAMRPASRDRWNVSVVDGGRPVALIDVHVIEGVVISQTTVAMDDLGKVFMKAVEQW